LWASVQRAAFMNRLQSLIIPNWQFWVACK